MLNSTEILRGKSLINPANLSIKPRCLNSLLGMLAFSSTWVCNAGETGESRPNIIWFVVEDISPYLGCYGDTIARTPNLDQLASEGVMFTNVFSVSGVCAPSRSALITGCYPTAMGTHNMRTHSNNSKPEGIPSHEAVIPPEVRMFTHYLREAGYFCMNKGKKDFQFGEHRTAWDDMNGSWDKDTRGKPFFLYMNRFMVTHESSIWNNADHPQIIEPSEVNLPPYYPDNPVIRKDVARNYSNVAEMDEKMGEYLEELGQKGLLEKSIIVFFSDHGGPLPRGKREIYDTGLKVPLIIRFPNKEHAGTVVDDLISFVDLAPTMLSLAGVPIPESIQGQAFLGDQKAPTPRKYLYAARDRMDTEYDTRRAVRDKRFKYIKNYKPDVGRYQEIQYRLNMDLMNELLRLRDAGELNEEQMKYFAGSKPQEELYDTWNDPYELNNLAGDAAYADTLERLRNEHLAFLDKYPDLGFTPEKELLEEWWPGLEQPVSATPSFTIKNDSVGINCQDEGATIAYQLVPVGESVSQNWADWKIYSSPLLVPDSLILHAIAHRIGYKESKLAAFGAAMEVLNTIDGYAKNNDASGLTIDQMAFAGVQDIVREYLETYKKFIEAEDGVSDLTHLQRIVREANAFADIRAFAAANDASGLTAKHLTALGIRIDSREMDSYRKAIEQAEPEDIIDIESVQNLIYNFNNMDMDKGPSRWSVYPNPVFDRLHIHGLAGNIHVSLHDIQGQSVLDKKTACPAFIDFSMFPAGAYILNIKDQTKRQFVKIIK